MSSSLIGLRVASSPVVEARSFASVADGFLGAIVVFRMLVLFVVVCEGSFYSERLCRAPVFGKVCSLVVCYNKTNLVVCLVGYP